jgi:hypothetical protein
MVRSGGGEGHLLRKCFQGREIMRVGDDGVQGSDINFHHDGVGTERGAERPYDIKEMVSILDI